MVKELIAAGLTGDELLKTVMKATGMTEQEALFLISIETGQTQGDVVRQLQKSARKRAGEVWGKTPPKVR